MGLAMNATEAVRHNCSPKLNVNKRKTGIDEIEAEDDEEYEKEKEMARKRDKEREEAFRELKNSFSVWHLVDPSRPWLLVESGSLAGYFDFVPKALRAGPWSFQAFVYSTVLMYGTAVVGAYYINQLLNDRSKHDESVGLLEHAAFRWWQRTNLFELEYPEAFSTQWWYNASAGLWMSYIVWICIHRVGIAVWATYTVQSWSLLWARHLLCALVPWWTPAKVLAEAIRFPALCSASTTFVVWNFVLLPAIYIVGMKTRVQRQRFHKFNRSFLLVNLHVLNIMLCTLNGTTITNPARELEPIDLYLAILSMVIYMAWYLFVLDRLGVPLYPIFSPRIGNYIFISWTSVPLVYLVQFWFWKRVLSA